MKLLPVEYYGYADLDRRFTNQMLPWIVAEIKRNKNSTKVCLGVEDGNIQAYDTNFEQQFSHRARFIVRFAQGSCEGNVPKEQQDADDGTGGSGDSRSFLYVVKEPTQQTRKLQLHAFRAVQPEDVTELYNQIRQAGGSMSHLTSSPYGTPPSLSRAGSGPTILTSNGGNGSNTTLTSLCTDISPSSSHFFEVLYIGKIKVSHRRVPETFIDDALHKFQLHEQEKLRDHFRHLYDNRRGSQDSTTSDTGSNEGVPFVNQSNSALSSPSTPVESFQPFEVDQKASPYNSGDEGSKSDSAIGSSTSTVTSPTNIDIKVDQSETSNDSLDSDTDTPQTNPAVTRTRTVSESVMDRKTITRSKTVEELISNSKTMSKSFENVNSITKTIPKLEAPSFVQTKTGSTEALPTVAEDKDENPAQTKVGPFNKLSPSLVKRSRASSIGNGQILRHYTSSNGTEQQSTNRTMVFLVGRTDLRLISPDRKQILLHKQLRDVATCVQGVRNPDHFGFICREHSQECFMGYIFKCQSDSVAVDVVQAITQAFTATQRLSTNSSSARDIPTYAPVAITTCEHCPLIWYQRLCAEVEGRDDRRTHTVIMRRVAQLDECDQALLTARLKESEVDTLKEQNELLMSLLRQHCEQKQNRHVHDTAENRSEFLNQYLGGSTIFMKAKRSLSNSFDHLLKRKGSRDDFGQALKDAAASYAHDSSPNSQTLDVPGQNDGGSNTPDGSRSRTSTISSGGDDRPTDLPGSLKLEQPAKDDKQLKSPMMDIFFKVGSSSGKSGLSDESIINKPASWRQQMFNRAVNPSQPAELSRGPSQISLQSTSTKRDRAELRALWKKAIHQALLLIRMEKENARLKARQEESAVKRIKLEYDEISPCQKGLMEMWEMLVTKESRITLKCDNQMLLQAVRQGVPRTKRGEVWNFLAHQYCLRAAPPDVSDFPNYNAQYEVLLKQLTAHQHAILIDLGRTFPNHPYFSSPLGPGQLALFNLLKAYSLLDPEVGYCQGLSFIAGVLLLHMAEDDAFFLLRHLMFRRGLRRQYLPDMQALQVRLYQLSRLLHDQLPDLYDHFDAHDVSTALYAAPWMLTLFASQFPLGFVTRVFDLLFLDSSDVLFRVALALLNHHHDNLLKCNSFEEIMDYLKTTVPAIDSITLDKVMKQVLTTDVSKQLTEYRVEYHVLQEEMASVRPQLDLLSKLDAQNKDLVRQNNTLVEQLEIAMSNVNRLETTRSVHQATINRLETQARGLEVTVATLGSFINVLIERKLDIEVPGDVRRIVTQLALAQERRRGGGKQTNENIVPPNQRQLTKSLSMTKLGLGFGKTNKDVPMIRSSSVNVGLGQNLNNTPNNKIADPPIKFSGSRGFPLKVIDDDESYEDIKQEKNKQNLTTENQKQKSVPLTNKPYPLKTALSQPILGSQKSSGFFANSHMQIQQQRMNALALKQGVKDSLGAELQFIKDVTSGLDRNIIENSTKVLKDEYGKSLHSDNEKSMSLPLSPYKGATDSGIGTPVSPAKDCNMSQILPAKDCASDVPPLFDSDVSFTYNGTTKLKSIRPLAAKQH